MKSDGDKKYKKDVTPLLRQCFVTAAVLSGALGHGCGQGHVAVLVPQLQRPGAPIPLTASDASWIASIIGPSFLMGNLMVPPLMSRLGRRRTTQAIAFLALVGWFITIMAENVWHLLIGKTFLSLTYGMSLPVRGVMLGEYTSPRYRGALLATMALGHTSGLLIVHTLGSFFSWQLTALIVTGFQFACVVMTFYYPESPSYLVSIGKYDECKKAYRWLRGENEEDELRKMIEARSVINKQNTEDARQKPGFKKFIQVVRKPELYKPIILMTHVYLLSQFSGATILASYPMQVLGNLLDPEANLHFWMVFLDAQRLFGNALALVVMNRVKRRMMIFSFGVLSIVTQISLASYGYLRYNGMLVYKANWIPLLLINLQMFASAMGLVPTSGVMSGEVFPLQYRGDYKPNVVTEEPTSSKVTGRHSTEGLARGARHDTSFPSYLLSKPPDLSVRFPC
ncbi:unnamed protein product [Plutella xylostella]|uniref:(diamondback moth) hypothetical protein n=1 Tax=Plutella xylostella TaxID=51655 RepID=A0A8S4FMH8_PLUXY|nr:unnamed protein product [Plutella xylostella]